MKRDRKRVRGNPELSFALVGSVLGLTVRQVRYALLVGKLRDLTLGGVLDYWKSKG